jgi:hypothetical protein
MCASEQDKFEPFFLYVSQSVIRGKPPALNSVISSLGMNSRRFRQCMNDVNRAELALEEIEGLHFTLGLTGVPSVMVGRRSFSLTDADSIVHALRRENG